MKIAFINTWRGGAVYNISKPIADELVNRGHEVDYLTIDGINLMGNMFDPSFSDYDVVHITYFSNAAMFYEPIEVPFTVGVHHIPAIHGKAYANMIRMVSPHRVVVSNEFALIQLGQMGITDVSMIPYTFDHAPFKHMPYPDEFTVGILGGNYETKRFTIIRQACDLAKLPLKEFVRDSADDDSKDFEEQSNITKFYEGISCYAVASFDEGGPLPPQEALLCGRPVVTTYVGMMPRIIMDGVNGRFHCGSPSDLAEKLIDVRDTFSNYIIYAKDTTFPSPADSAPTWERMFEDIKDD